MKNLIERIFIKKEKPKTDRDILTDKLIGIIGDAKVNYIEDSFNKFSYYSIDLRNKTNIKARQSSFYSPDLIGHQKIVLNWLWVNGDEAEPEEIDHCKVYDYISNLHKSQKSKRINQAISALS